MSPHVNQMNLVFMVKNKKFSVPLQYPELLWKHSQFQTDLNTVILVTGWTSNINETNDAMKTLWNAYKCRGNINFIVSFFQDCMTIEWATKCYKWFIIDV